LLAVWIVGKAGSYELFHPSRSTIRRTGRLLTPSMPVSNSAFPASPPQPLCPGAQTSASRWTLKRTAIGGVTELWHLSRAAVSPARDGIGSFLGGRTWPTWAGC
jgi:hypothetical protein